MVGRRDRAKCVGAPIGYRDGPIRTRQKPLQQCGALPVDRTVNKSEVVGGHERSGANFSILRICASPKTRVPPRFSYAPTAPANCASTMTFYRGTVIVSASAVVSLPEVEGSERSRAGRSVAHPRAGSRTHTAGNRAAPDLPGRIVQRSIPERRHRLRGHGYGSRLPHVQRARRGAAPRGGVADGVTFKRIKWQGAYGIHD